MKVVTIFGRSRSRWVAGCGLAVALIALSAAAPARAQVIEIDDDGSTRVFSGPTRFVSGETDQAAAKPQTRSDNVDEFERIARIEGVDVRLLRAVARTESQGRMSAVSSKGALGIMQLMPATAAELGVDPLDRDANITGGARYLARMVSRFRSVPLALAAYNAGPNAVLRWGGIPPYAETRSYVASILWRWQGGSVTPSPKAIVPVNVARVDPMLIEVPSL